MAQQVLGDNTHAQLGLGDERPRDAPRCCSARPRGTAQRAQQPAPRGPHGIRRVRVSVASMRPPCGLRRARDCASADRTVDALAWEELVAVACGRAHSLAASHTGEVTDPLAAF
jgi:hypothetical protein